MSWIRLYWKFLVWIRDLYGIELMCMASAFLFMTKGGFPKGIKNISARPICMRERNLEHIDKSRWTSAQIKFHGQLVARKNGANYNFKNAEENMLKHIIPNFFKQTFPTLDDYNHIGAKWDYDAFSRHVPKPFNVRFLLKALAKFMPNVCTYAMEQEPLEVWKIEKPIVTIFFFKDQSRSEINK